MFNNWLFKGKNNQVYSICQFPQCKYSHNGQFQTTNMRSLIPGVGKDAQNRFWGIRPVRLTPEHQSSCRSLDQAKIWIKAVQYIDSVEKYLSYLWIIVTYEWEIIDVKEEMMQPTVQGTNDQDWGGGGG